VGVGLPQKQGKKAWERWESQVRIGIAGIREGLRDHGQKGDCVLVCVGTCWVACGELLEGVKTTTFSGLQKCGGESLTRGGAWGRVR